MGTNFDFIAPLWPAIHSDCVRAESYARTDPRTTTIYARRVVEQIIERIYEIERLPSPYKNDLNARIADERFRRKVGQDFAIKADLIRKVGNEGVHGAKSITAQTALNAMRHLYDMVVWAAFRYSVSPDTIPTASDYDPSRIPEPQTENAQPPLSAEELIRLNAKFEELDAQLAAERAANAALEAELQAHREAVAAAQAAKRNSDQHDYREAETRAEHIDRDLQAAGWPLTDPRDREYPVHGLPTTDGRSGTGFVDYVLWGADGLPLGIVEAKRSSRDEHAGQEQARQYADALEAMTGRRPVIFLSNGLTHTIWDDAAGYPPRPVRGFYSPAELALLVQRRTTRLPLTDVPVSTAIAGRHYQQRAIRAVDAAFTKRARRALLVMATGSGKTRTAIAMVDHLMKAGWVTRVLFLADRQALVRQAAGAFKTHLPDVTTVNLLTDKAADGRVYVCTYQTMMGLINGRTDAPMSDNSVGQRFGPGYFDLIFIDEAHRSVYQKYGEIFGWFDALLVGLTATPKADLDRNTYDLFHLENGVPTDAYDLDQAVAEGHLVPPTPLSVPLKFPREGIHYDDLTEEERDAWDALDWPDEDHGPPTDIDPEALNRWLYNTDTIDKVLETLMRHGHYVEGGDRIGKTIIFAKNQRHAHVIAERFDRNYPEHAGLAARVITSGMERTDDLIDDFGETAKRPDIAVSVDMLDTGIDIPDVCNLVLFKRVLAPSKFWQMIGRGTRLRPDLFGPGRDKADFRVFDFCQNFEFFNQPGAGSEGVVAPSLGQRLFAARLALIAGLDERLSPYDDAGRPPISPGEREDEATRSDAGLRAATAGHLHAIVSGMNLDNFLVRPKRGMVSRYAQAGSWRRVTREDAQTMAAELGGLPSAVREDGEAAKRFDLLILRLQLALLESRPTDRWREQVQGIAEGLLAKTTIPQVAAQAELLDQVAGDDWWVDVTLPMLELARLRIRGLVTSLDPKRRVEVMTDFEDELGEITQVELRGLGPGTDWARFKAKASAYLREHEDNVALQKLRRNHQLTATDLSALEEMLLASGADPESVARAGADAQGLGLFIRSLVGLDRVAATEAFSAYLSDGTYSAAQIHFVNLIVEHLTSNGVMDVGRLYDPPFTDHAPRGPETLFSEPEVESIVVILDKVRSHALPADVA